VLYLQGIRIPNIYIYTHVDRRDYTGGPGQEVALQRNSGYAAEVCFFFLSSAKDDEKIKLIDS